MDFAVHHILGVVLLMAAGGRSGLVRPPMTYPAPDATAEHRKSFLEGVLLATRQQQAMMARPPVGFNTKDVLAGIESVEVIAEDLAPEVEKYGLSQQDLRVGIEAQLRRHRIEVIFPNPARAAEAQDARVPQQAEEPNDALMPMLKAETEESFKQGVKDYLRRSEPVSASGMLDVTVSAVVDEVAGFAAYSVHVQFLQPVKLLRPEPARSLAATWAVGKVGTVLLKDLPSVAEQAGEIVDAFIEDYFAANLDKAPRTAVRETRTPPTGVVTGIVRSRDFSTAVIGTDIVREGDTIDGVTIVKIHDDKVEFEKAGQRWTQKINEPPAAQWR